MQLKKCKTKQYDNTRHALQAPISQTKLKVMWLVNGKEKQSPWLYKREHAQRLLSLIQTKYGEKNAIIFRD
ncbi:hypothetical protein [Cellvibrio mixtus]|uniref:hypothetical protein n=1 Tax=Cellvibrio mixtus TaxID=39650 RepID=UPI000587C77F|nr:hypothetical protein [Cellvibrio mixtus]